MKITSISLVILVMCNGAIAGQNFYSSDLAVQRGQVIREYIFDLEKADYQDITALFEEHGTVISTSRGSVDAKDFFYSFLPNIESASTQLQQSFISNVDNNRYAAQFHFGFKLKNGEMNDGEYVDEFIFGNNSAKFISVYMFENLKFNVHKK